MSKRRALPLIAFSHFRGTGVTRVTVADLARDSGPSFSVYFWRLERVFVSPVFGCVLVFQCSLAVERVVAVIQS